MTDKSKEQLQKELRYFTERERSFNQIISIVYELTWVLGRVTVAYFILLLAIIGSYQAFTFYWRPVAMLLVFAFGSMWIFCGVNFYSVYKPILKDGEKGMKQICDKAKSAITAWRNTK